jgi:hypothetical protein
MERLSGEYNRGFTQGLLAVQEVLKYIQQDLAHHKKRLTPKLMDDLMQCCIKNRERLRESMNGFIRYNGKTNSFEFYEPNTRR